MIPSKNSTNWASKQFVTESRLRDFSNDPIRCMQSLYDRHGELAVLQEGPQKIVFAFGSKWNRLILNDESRFHSRFFAIRGPRRSAQRRLTSGLLSMNGPTHKTHRRMVMGPFQKQAIANHLTPVAQLCQSLLDTWQVGETRDMNLEMTQFMRQVTSSLLFGVEHPELALELGEIVDDWVHMNHQMGMGALVSDDSFNEGYEKLLEKAEQLESMVQKLIDLKRSAPRLGHDVLSLLLHARDEGQNLSDEEMIGHVTLLFGAAHLTTAYTLSWTLFLLAKHPQVLRGVWEEIGSQVQGPSPTFEELSNLQSLTNVIKESMRILPASAYLQRMAVTDVQVGPLSLSYGTSIVFSQFMTHRIPQLFPEPDLFYPDRWREISPSPFAYFPFGAGARMCIGAMLATLTLKTVLPTILKRYRLSLQANTQVNGAIVGTMLGPTSPIWMKIHPADGRFDSPPVQGNIQDLVRLGNNTPLVEMGSRIAA